jgi:hypothetical protein
MLYDKGELVPIRKVKVWVEWYSYLVSTKKHHSVQSWASFFEGYGGVCRLLLCRIRDCIGQQFTPNNTVIFKSL